MAYKIGYAENYKELLVATKGFLCNAKKAYNIAAGSNTGNGYVSAERASTSPVDETWTLTATSSTNFTVTGSVSGAQAAATVGTPYDNGIVAFTIVAGDTAFVSSDSFTFDVADGLGATQCYTAERWDTDYDGNGEYELILNAPGLAGSDAIYTAIQTVSDVGGDWYNWRLAGLTGFTSGVDLQYQNGITQGRLPRMLLWNNKIQYWIVANGRRYIIVAKVSTVFEACYLGFEMYYNNPTQFPYPMMIGGAACPGTTDADNRYSSIATSHRAFPNSYADGDGVCTSLTFDTGDYSSLKVLRGANWVKVRSKVGSNLYYVNNCHPYVATLQTDFWSKIRENLDGSRQPHDIHVMLSSPNRHICGPMQGCQAVPGYGGVAGEDDFTIDADTYIAVPIVPNASGNDFWILKLE